MTTEEDAIRNVSKRFRAALESRGLTQVDVHRATGTSTTTLNRVFNGKQLPNTQLVIALWQEFEILPSWLLTGSGEDVAHQTEIGTTLDTSARVPTRPQVIPPAGVPESEWRHHLPQPNPADTFLAEPATSYGDPAPSADEPEERIGVQEERLFRVLEENVSHAELAHDVGVTVSRRLTQLGHHDLAGEVMQISGRASLLQHALEEASTQLEALIDRYRNARPLITDKRVQHFRKLVKQYRTTEDKALITDFVEALEGLLSDVVQLKQIA